DRVEFAWSRTKLTVSVYSGASRVRVRAWTRVTPAKGELVGRQAPPLNDVLSWVGSAAPDHGQKLRLIEFWATWCQPCIDRILALELLVANHESELDIIWVSDEEPAVVEAFLAQRPLVGAVAMDTERKLFDEWHIDGLPRAVVLDPDGVVVADSRYHELDDTRIERLVAGERLDEDVSEPSVVGLSDPA